MAARTHVARDLVAREYSFVNVDCLIGPRVTLGRYAMIGPRVSVVGGDHRFDSPGVPIIFSGRPAMPRTVVEDDAWIGCGAVIIAGVCIGRGAIVAAGAVVTRDVPPYEIHGGVPARKIGERFADDTQRARHDEMLRGPVVEPRFAEPLEQDTGQTRR
jgi:acetyltransferase-like isoleucine patch superfamily enzyme